MVFDADAQLERITRSQAAVHILARIRLAIANYRTERSANSLLFSGLIALAATAGLAVALAILVWLRRRVESLMHRRLQKRMSHLKPEHAALAGTDNVWKALGAVLRGLGWLTQLVVIVMFTQFLLGLFPWTRGAANQLLGYLIDPVRIIVRGIIRFIPNFIFLAILALILGQDHLQQFYVIGIIALWIAMITATVSGIDYYLRYARATTA